MTPCPARASTELAQEDGGLKVCLGVSAAVSIIALVVRQLYPWTWWVSATDEERSSVFRRIELVDLCAAVLAIIPAAVARIAYAPWYIFCVISIM